jgi:hypothetical protein
MKPWCITVPCFVREVRLEEEEAPGPFSGTLVFEIQAEDKETAIAIVADKISYALEHARDRADQKIYVDGNVR